MIFLRRVYPCEKKKQKRSLLTIAADAFAAMVILASVMFLFYDSLYLLRRYLPRIVSKVKHRMIIDPDADELLQGKTIDIGKAISGGNSGTDDDDR